MIRLSSERAASLTGWFEPERRAIVALHALSSGLGDFHVDRWPEPQVLLIRIGSLQSLLGKPRTLRSSGLIELMGGMMYCSREFLPLLQEALPEVRAVERVVLELQREPQFEAPEGFVLRRLTADDADTVRHLSPGLQFIGNTWGGPAGLAATGLGWGAYSDGRLVSISATFLQGDTVEDIAVATEADFRGRGLAGACAGFLCQDVQRRGKRATWTTSASNHASLRVAEKIGFQFHAHEILYVLGSPASLQSASA